jgi:hypothetical protein
MTKSNFISQAMSTGRAAAPSEQCPNCGHWVKAGDCHHHSSGPVGTLYGVCGTCASQHAAFSAMMREVMVTAKRPGLFG